MASTAVIAVVAASASAHGAEIRFNIPEQSLETALADFSAQSLVPVLTTPAMTGQKRTAGIVGAAEPPEALQILLNGTGLVLSKNPFKLISYAAFGEVYYEITPNLKLTAGLRYTVERRRRPRSRAGCSPA